jgi:hypothetical protein
MKRSLRTIDVGIAVIAVSTVINLFVSGYYTKTTRDIFDSSYRPYVAVSATFLVPGPGAASTLHVNFRNFGTIPAIVTRAEWQVFVNGVKIPIAAGVREKTILFEGMRGELAGLIPPDSLKQFRVDRKPFEVEVWLKYQGLRQTTFNTYQKSSFNNLTRNFEVTRANFR